MPSNPVLMLRSDESGFDVIKRSQSNDDVFELFDVLD